MRAPLRAFVRSFRRSFVRPVVSTPTRRFTFIYRFFGPLKGLPLNTFESYFWFFCFASSRATRLFFRRFFDATGRKIWDLVWFEWLNDIFSGLYWTARSDFRISRFFAFSEKINFSQVFCIKLHFLSHNCLRNVCDIILGSMQRVFKFIADVLQLLLLLNAFF